MSKKFSGWAGKEATPPGPIIAPDEIVLVVRYSESAKYIDVTEKNGKPIGAMQGVSVMLQLAMQFLGALAQERAMLVGQGGKNDDTEKKDGN